MSHLAALRASLEREREATMAEHARMRLLPMAERVAAGFSLSPLDLVQTEFRSRFRVNVLLRGQALGDAFSPGDPVVLGPVGRPDAGWSGRVDGVDAGTIELRVDDVPEGKGPWAVSRRLDFHILDLQSAALLRAERLSSPIVNLLAGYERPYRADPWEHPAFATLNASQRQAAELVLGSTEIGLLHGPPGTGKTETLVAVLVALRELGEKPWALADSNAAVDHLALRASAAGLDVVRVGVSARIASAVQPLTLEHRILSGARAEVIKGLMRQASRTTGPGGVELRDAIRDEWAAAKREILESADVLAMTLGTLHTRATKFPPPKTAVVDEASQIAEPALWLLASMVKRLFLAGDPQQLGPVVKSRDPMLERSLLARLVDAGFVFPMLTEQYRMNDELLALSSPTYGGRIRSAPGVAVASHSPAARWIDTAGMGHDEERDSLGSMYNLGELALTRRIWGELREAGIRPDQVGVITPYNAQLSRIRATMPEVESGTVNAFQGREKDVILASFVRSNPEQELGFVADPRRLNVAVSRARHRFIGIGDTATLGASQHFQRVIEAIHVGGGYASGWEYAE